MLKWNMFLENYTNQTLKSIIYNVIRLLLQYFVEACLAVITALSLLGLQASHTWLWAFYPLLPGRFFQVPSDWMRQKLNNLDSNSKHCVSPKISSHKFGLTQEQPETLSRSSLVLTVCFGSLSCWRTSPWTHAACTLGMGCSQGRHCVLLFSCFFQLWPVSMFLPLSCTLIAWCCLTIEMVWAVPGVAKHSDNSSAHLSH